MRVVFTGTRLPSASVRAWVCQQGWEWVHVPLFRLAPTVPADLAVQLAWATWVIVTSQETVGLLAPYWHHLSQARVMAVGPLTSKALGEVGVAAPHPQGVYSYEAVIEAMPPSLTGERILVPGSAWSDDQADHRLVARGATVRRCVVYEPYPTGLSLPFLTAHDVVVVSSPAQARGVGVVPAHVIAIGDKAQMALGDRARGVAVGDDAGLLATLREVGCDRELPSPQAT